MIRSSSNSFHPDTPFNLKSLPATHFTHQKRKPNFNKSGKLPFQHVPLHRRVSELSRKWNATASLKANAGLASASTSTSTTSAFSSNSSSFFTPPRNANSCQSSVRGPQFKQHLQLPSPSSTPQASHLTPKPTGCPFAKPLLFKESAPLASTIDTALTHSTTVQTSTTPDSSSLIHATPPVSKSSPSLQRPSPTKIIFSKSTLTKNNQSVVWKIRPVGSGLINEGCTCYCNATLQALLYLPPFIQVFETRMHSAKCTVHECYFCILENLYRQMMCNSQSVVHPNVILLRLKRIGAEFSRHRQSDANEFMIKLLERVESSLLLPFKSFNLDYPSKCTTLLHQIMGSWMQSEVKCPQCRHVSTTFTNEWFCSLEIPSGVDSIEKALHRYTRTEILGSGNEWKCEKCQNYVNASKRITFCEPPLILCLQLKRFEFPSHFVPKKLTKSVSFKEHLDLQPYVTMSQSKSELSYSLQSVIVHYGSVHGGHYIAYIKAPNGLWHEMNDTRVRPISLHTVLSATSDSYVLFYTSKEACSPLTLCAPSSSATCTAMPSPPHSLASSPILTTTSEDHPTPSSSSTSLATASSSTMTSSSLPLVHRVSDAAPAATSIPSTLTHVHVHHTSFMSKKNSTSSIQPWYNPALPNADPSYVQKLYNKAYLDQTSAPVERSKRPNSWDWQYDQGKLKKPLRKKLKKYMVKSNFHFKKKKMKK